jgi:hypothetical protein
MESNFIENNTKQLLEKLNFKKEALNQEHICTDEQGKIISDYTAIKNKWKGHFQQLLQSKMNNIHHNSQ